jgi:hypothetical protein
MGLIYGYLFPAIFLAAFWVLYRHEPVPLAGHMGELLTVSILGGACFGLPTTLVSERERGVWRRYRLAPVSSGALVASTVAARYLILITSGLLQIALAMAIGMPFPDHPVALWVAFTFASFAFLGLGLVIAMLADNVPAVQALGQCIFLPMLIIGGVAVRLASLPPWAQHLSAFFPGRYAVETMQECVTGDGLRLAYFGLLALLLIGAAGCVAGARMFRWDANQRFAARGGKVWLLAALAAWVAVGLLAEAQGRATLATPASTTQLLPVPTAAPPAAPVAARPGDSAPAAPARTAGPAASDTTAATILAPAAATGTSAAATPDTGSRTAAASAPPAAPLPPQNPASWREVDPARIDPSLFRNLPPDEDVVAPIGSPEERIYRDEQIQIQCIGDSLRSWAPAQVADPVQRARNFLYVAAVPDVLQLTIERWVPGVVFTHMRADFVRGDLVRSLYWIATHPDEGSLPSLTDLRRVCLDVGGTEDRAAYRDRIRIYALKLLGRLTGAIPEM